MNPDSKKLIQILNNLEKDYQDGLISEEKYFYLADQYRYKIKTIEVSARIRAMQGKKETPNSFNSKNNVSEKYRKEKEQLVRKYINNPEYYNVLKKPKESQPTNPWYMVLAILLLLVAFSAGITFGMSNISLENNVTNIFSNSATINDTAFPEIKENKTYNHNHTKSHSNTMYESYSDDDSKSSYNYDKKYSNEKSQFNDVSSKDKSYSREISSNMDSSDKIDYSDDASSRNDASDSDSNDDLSSEDSDY